MTAATLRFPSPRAYHFGLALAFTVVYALAVTTYLAAAQIMSPHHATKPKPWNGPSWSAPLKGVTPYSVEKGYGTSRGMTCDLTIYTTNKPALDGNARLHPGDTTATVCVVRKVK